MEYEQELEATVREAAEKIERGEDAKQLLEEAQELVDQLKIEARSKEEKRKVAMHQERLKELKARGSLFGGAKKSSGSSATSGKDRQRLTDARERARGSSQQIEKTKEMLDEIEDTGADIITELHRNRETIEKINGHVKETKGELDKADKMVTRMYVSCSFCFLDLLLLPGQNGGPAGKRVSWVVTTSSPSPSPPPSTDGRLTVYNSTSSK